MEILKISALILISVILISSLPVYNKNISALISLSVSVIVVLYIISFTENVLLTVRHVTEKYISSDFTVIYKAMGISLLTQFVSDTAVCRKGGHSSTGYAIVYAGA